MIVLNNVIIKNNPLLKISEAKESFNIFIVRNQIPLIELTDVVKFLYNKKENICLLVHTDEKNDLFNIQDQKLMWASIGVNFDETRTLLQQFEYKKPYIESLKDIVDLIDTIMCATEEPVFWIRKEQENLFKGYITKLFKDKNITMHYGIVETEEGQPLTSVSEVLEKYSVSLSFESKDSIEEYTEIEICETIDSIMKKHLKSIT